MKTLLVILIALAGVYFSGKIFRIKTWYGWTWLFFFAFALILKALGLI